MKLLNSPKPGALFAFVPSRLGAMSSLPRSPLLAASLNTLEAAALAVKREKVRVDSCRLFFLARHLQERRKRET